MSGKLSVELASPGTLEAGAGGAKLVQGPKGEPGAVYVPSVSGGVLSWTNDAGLENPAPADISGPQGPKGPKGDKGDKGDAGERGPQGEAGPAGRKGRRGERGPKGETGAGLEILGQYDTPAALEAAVPAPEIGDNYYVGESAPYDIYTWTEADGTQKWLDGGKLQGAPGEAGGYYVPSVDAGGNLSWTASGADMPEAAGANIMGPQGAAGPAGEQGEQGPAGEDGGYYAPSVDAGGNLSWTASRSGMPAAPGANIMGPPGADGAAGPAGAPATINGVNALTLAAGERVQLQQSGSTLTIGVEPQDAAGVPFDPTGLGLTSTNVQDAIEELMWALGLL